MHSSSSGYAIISLTNNYLYIAPCCQKAKQLSREEHRGLSLMGARLGVFMWFRIVDHCTTSV